MIDLVKAQQL